MVAQQMGKNKPLLPDDVNDLKERMKIVWFHIIIQLITDRMKVRLDQKTKPVAFEVSMSISISKELGSCPKLQRSLEGPYLVIKNRNDFVYRIQSKFIWNWLDYPKVIQLRVTYWKVLTEKHNKVILSITFNFSIGCSNMITDDDTIAKGIPEYCSITKVTKDI